MVPADQVEIEDVNLLTSPPAPPTLPQSPPSRLAGTLTIFACTISGGLLTLPCIFAEAAIVPSLCLILASAVTTGCSLLALVLLSDLNEQVVNYGSLIGWLFAPRQCRRLSLAFCNKKFKAQALQNASSRCKHSRDHRNKCAEKSLEFVVGLFLVGVLGGSFIIVHDYMAETFQGNALAGDISTVTIAFFISLIALPKDIKKLAFAAKCSVFAFSFLVFTFVYYGTEQLTNPENGNVARLPWWPMMQADFLKNQTKGNHTVTQILPSHPKNEWTSIGKSLPPILYAFGCQIQVFDIFKGVLAGRTNGMSAPMESAIADTLFFMPSIVGAVSMMCLTFALVGVFGVVTFSDTGAPISGDVLVMLVSKGALGNVARGVLVVACILSAPLVVHPTRHCLYSMLRYIALRGKTDTQSESSVVTNAMLTFGIVAASAGLVLLRIDFLSLVGALGTFIASPLFFVVPGIALLVTLREHVDKGETGLLEEGLVEGGMSTAEKERATCSSRLQPVRPTLNRHEAILLCVVAVWLVCVGIATFALNMYQRYSS